jgi:hypothetical protein
LNGITGLPVGLHFLVSDLRHRDLLKVARVLFLC